jgi:outer membrane lipoprotein carrier protein
MSLLLTVLLFFTQTSRPSPPADLSTVVKGVDRLFAGMKDFSADFVQIDQISLNRKEQGAGHVYLMRPKMARYEYTSPEERLFVSDGKKVYFYVPADRQVRWDQLKEAIDDRIPLMFLVGRSNLRDEFERFETLSVKPEVEGTMVIQMYPKRKTDLTQLVMEVEPQSYLIRRLVMTHSDGSRTDLRFSNIRVNTGLKSSLFDFKIPEGTKVREGIGQ